MKRKLKYVILFTVLLSIIVFKIFTTATYPNDMVAINEIREVTDCLISEDSSEIRVEYNGDSTGNYIIYGDTSYEGEAYVPLAIAISEELNADVRIIKYNFLGNIGVLLHQPKDEILIAHGNGSEYVGFVAAKADGVILLGNTPFTKVKNENAMIIQSDLDMVSECIKKALPSTALYYRIEKGNFSNYVYAGLHKKDASPLITREEQIDQCIKYIEDFVSSLDL